MCLQGTGCICTLILQTLELTGWDKRCRSANSSSPTTKAAPTTWHRYWRPCFCSLSSFIRAFFHFLTSIHTFIPPISVDHLYNRFAFLLHEPKTQILLSWPVRFPSRWSCSSLSTSTSLVFTLWRWRRTARRTPSSQPKPRPSSSQRLNSSPSQLIRTQM